MNLREFLTVVLIAVVAFISGWSFAGRRESVRTVTVTRVDTIVRERVVPQRVVVERVVYDTLHTRDSLMVEVAVPISRYHFADSLYRAEISGYGVSLDRIELFSRTKTVTIPPVPLKRWGVGIQAGYGIGPRGAAPYIGVGVSYNVIVF